MRKVAKVVIDKEGGRDAGKSFILTEMSAMRAERWATRFILSVAKAGIDIPEGQGMAAVAALNINLLGKISMGDADILLSEMMECVALQPDPVKMPQFTRPLMEDDIEEVKTLVKIRMEVLTLHTGFSIPGFQSNLMMLEPGQIFLSTGISPAHAGR